MRKPWKALVLVICLLFILPSALAGCGGGDDSDAIIGVWTEQEGFIEYEFKSGGVLVVRAMGQEEQTTYSVENGKLSLSDMETGELREFEYEIDGDDFTISGEGEEETLVRRK